MKKIGILLTIIIMAMLFAVSASAATEGYYTYDVYDGEAEITDVDTSISGDVTIPSTLGGYSVTAIGKNAFWECNSLTSIIIPDGVTSIGYWAFGDCTGLTSITIPDSVISIDENAFRSCSSLKSLVIPDSVKYIGERAFMGCASLTSLTVPFVGTGLNNGTDSYRFKYLFKHRFYLANRHTGVWISAGNV